MWRSFKSQFFLLVIFVPIMMLARQGKLHLADNDIPRRVASIRTTLPQKLGDSLELQNISYENRTIHYDVIAMSFFEKSTFEEGAFHDAVLNQYCKGKDRFQKWRYRSTTTFAFLPVRSTTAPPTRG